MKKWIIIAGSFLLLGLLAIRGLYKTVTRVDEEKRWYVSQLNLKCTLEIDSIATFAKKGNGLLYCKLISGDIDNSTEFKLNKKLRHHKRIKFLTPGPHDCYLIYSRRSHEYLVKDSLRIDSKNDQVTFYRAGAVFRQAKVSNFLRDRIF